MTDSNKARGRRAAGRSATEPDAELDLRWDAPPRWVDAGAGAPRETRPKGRAVPRPVADSAVVPVPSTVYPLT
jgi:hypothetical protein